MTLMTASKGSAVEVVVPGHTPMRPAPTHSLYPPAAVGPKPAPCRIRPRACIDPGCPALTGRQHETERSAPRPSRGNARVPVPGGAVDTSRRVNTPTTFPLG